MNFSEVNWIISGIAGVANRCYDGQANSVQKVFKVSKTFLTVIIVSLLVLPVSAQASRQGRPAPKSAPAKSKAEDKTQQAAELFEAGQAAHESRDLAKAVELYSRALELDPELWQAEYQRGSAYYSLGKLAEAKTSMLRVGDALKQYPESDQVKQISLRVQMMIGEISLADSKPEEAEMAFRRVVEIDPQNARAHSALAEILLAANKHVEAIAEAKAAIAAGDDRAATFALLGVALTINNKFDEALPALNEALKREPKNTLALLYRAEVLVSQNKTNEAAADLQAALAIEPNTRTKLRLATLLAKSGKFDEAIASFQEAVNAEPDNAEARASLTAALIDSGKAEEAISQLEQLIKTEPNRAALHAQLAELYLPKQPDKAFDQYKLAAELEPKNAGHQVGMASALVKQRKFQEAVDLLKPLLAANPKGDAEYYAHTNMATALFELDDFPNAAREFIWILNHTAKRGDQKRTAITLYFLGICLDKLGDYEQALKAYEQFMTLATPENQLEIDKIKLRLPPLKRQIEQGKGKRKK